MSLYFNSRVFLCLLFLTGSFLMCYTYECPTEFDEMCECGLEPYGPEKRLVYVTNCTDAGFDNTMMLRQLPSETQVLIFTGNEIKDLPLNVLGQDILYENLHIIDMSNNHIQTIKGRTFHNVGNVTKLLLNDNDLYIVSKDSHPRMLSNFVNLRELHLRNAFTRKVRSSEYLKNLAEIFENSVLHHLQIVGMEDNDISELYNNQFCSLPALQELHLGGNHLKDINLNFSCHKNLKLLDASNNNIPYLSEDTIRGFGNILNSSEMILNLTGNPFRCDCHMVKTYIFLMTTPINVVNKGGLICQDGFALIVGKPITSVQIDELQCVPELRKLEYHSSAPLITLTIGLISLSIGLLVVIYRNHDSLGLSFRRMFYPIRRKFNYVSLHVASTNEV